MMYGYYPGYGGYGMMGYGVFHLIGGLLTFLFWLIVVILVVRLIRRRKLGGHPWMRSSSLELLKERYVKGEIDRAEYEEKKKVLES